jgi:hypothetical protein
VIVPRSLCAQDASAITKRQKTTFQKRIVTSPVICTRLNAGAEKTLRSQNVTKDKTLYWGESISAADERQGAECKI